jgi:hypothetical protein
VKNRFQNVPFKCNVRRYTVDVTWRGALLSQAGIEAGGAR